MKSSIKLNKVHHIAIIASDYEKSKLFYTQTLGFEILAERYRKARNSYKLDLALNGKYIIELFSFPDPPDRASFPEATGLRHLAFEVDDVQTAISELKRLGVKTEEVRVDEYTKKQMAFFFDPDDLPLELYQA